MCQTPFLPLWQPQMYSLMSYLRLWLLKHLTASMPLFIACLNCLFRIRLHIISLVWAWSCVIGFWQTCNLEAHTDGCWPSSWLKAISMPLYCLLLLNFVATRLCIIYIYIMFHNTLLLVKENGFMTWILRSRAMALFAQKDTSREGVEFATKWST